MKKRKYELHNMCTSLTSEYIEHQTVPMAPNYEKCIVQPPSLQHSNKMLSSIHKIFLQRASVSHSHGRLYAQLGRRPSIQFACTSPCLQRKEHPTCTNSWIVAVWCRTPTVHYSRPFKYRALKKIIFLLNTMSSQLQYYWKHNTSCETTLPHKGYLCFCATRHIKNSFQPSAATVAFNNNFLCSANIHFHMKEKNSAWAHH